MRNFHSFEVPGSEADFGSACPFLAAADHMDLELPDACLPCSVRVASSRPASNNVDLASGSITSIFFFPSGGSGPFSRHSAILPPRRAMPIGSLLLLPIGLRPIGFMSSLSPVD